MKPVGHHCNGAVRFFFAIFVCACVLFWWLPSILFRLLGLEDPIESWARWVSFLGVATFTAGYLVPPRQFKSLLPLWVIDACERFAYMATLWLAFPALVLALQFFFSRSGVEYGQGKGLSLLHQAVFYGHMFFAFLFLGAARTLREDRRRIIIVSVLVIAPRLIVSLRWGRFFLAQALLPVLLIALARGWVALSAKRVLQLCAIALFILFVPALTRGDSLRGQDALINFFQGGSSLRLLQDNRDSNLTGLCPPLLVSLTDKVVPYSLLGACTIEYLGMQGMPATLDRILTEDEAGTVGTLFGTGSNYLLELYLTGGIGAIILGSVLFGFTCRCFVHGIGKSSLFAGIWAECLSRALFAPRGNLGYVYERIPGLLLATLALVGLAWFFCGQAQRSLRGGDKTRPSPLPAH